MAEKITRILKGILRIRESAIGLAGTLICLFWVFVAVFADFISPFDPLLIIGDQSSAKPGAVTTAGITMWMGGDFLGRDILSRIIHGTRTVLLWSFLATASAYAVGIVFGLLAGYYRKFWDDVISFIANTILAFPVLLLLILIIGLLGPSGLSIVVAITFASSPAIYRIVRGEVLSIRNRDFIAAAQTRGENVLYILFVELLPNAKGPLIVDFCLRMGYTTIFIGALGFLGLGFPPPTPDWGGMVNENRQMALIHPHMTVYPCLAISLLVLGLNLMADGIREVTQKV